MRNKIILVLLLIAFPSIVWARLGESMIQSNKRYGSPVKEPHIHMVPLAKGTLEKRYHHNSWRIRAAYVNDLTVIISYMKLVGAGTPEATLKNDEIKAILRAEGRGKIWYEVKRGTKLTNVKRYQGYFNSATKLWKNSNGAIAWISGNHALSLISPQGLTFEMRKEQNKEKQRKANIMQF